jgi:hypothetical protein
MEDMPTYEDQEQGEELLPSLASVYQRYDDDMLQKFVDAAGYLLDGGVGLNRYHTIQLLILLANSVENPADTRELSDRAQAKYRKEQLYHQESDPDAISAIDVLGVKLDQVRKVVETEAAAEVRALEVLGEDNVKEDFSLSVDGADDREDTSNATETGPVAMALRGRTPLTSVSASNIITDCHAAEGHSKTFRICRQSQEEDSEAFEEVCKTHHHHESKGHLPIPQ